MNKVIALVGLALAATAQAGNLPEVIDWTEKDYELNKKFFSVGLDKANKYAKEYKTAGYLKHCGYPKMSEQLLNKTFESLTKDYLAHYGSMIDIWHGQTILETSHELLKTHNNAYAESFINLVDTGALDVRLKAGVCEIMLKDYEGMK